MPPAKTWGYLYYGQKLDLLNLLLGIRQRLAHHEVGLANLEG